MRRALRPAAAALLAVATVTALAACRAGAPSAGGATVSSSATATASTQPSAAASSPAAEPTPSPDPASSSATTTRITAPADGATVPGPLVTVNGEGTAFEGTLLWRVVAADAPDGAAVAEGYTEAGANGEVGPFAFDVELQPGTWTIQVWEPAMGEGETVEAADLVQVTVQVG